MRVLLVLLLLAGTAVAVAGGADLAAVVHKKSVAVHAKPDFSAPEVATLKRNAAVKIAGQQGLWYRLSLEGGGEGYVRVNDVRVASSGKAAKDGDGLQVLLTGKSGRGRVSETAGVRGIDESDLRSASFDAGQLAKMERNRATPQAAAAWAARTQLAATTVPWSSEAAPKRGNVAQSDARRGTSAARGLLGGLAGGLLGSALGVTEKAIPKSEAELAQEELELGPQIAGRILGARPLLEDAAAQQRVNLVGRWVASQSARPELPWTFGVIDTPEINAFAAPGGYVLITSGLYDLAGSDAELAAALGHEINHVVHRDHYEVIRKQELTSLGQDLASSHVSTGGGVAGGMARAYVEKHGATIMLTGLDRGAEYRSDEGAQVYLARSGMNPLAMYALLQKMTAMGSGSAGLAQLYRTHPPLDERLDRIDGRASGALQAYTSRD
jgi:Zn-dependent protease with chaperone function